MSQTASRTAVFYFVPEDGDDVKSPNVFSLGRAPNKVRLGDVKKTFPLPGAYQFRFKKAFKTTHVWMDMVDDFEVVPRFEGAIIAKVSRLRVAGRGPSPGSHYVHGHAPPVHHGSSGSNHSSSSSSSNNSAFSSHVSENTSQGGKSARPSTHNSSHSSSAASSSNSTAKSSSTTASSSRSSSNSPSKLFTKSSSSDLLGLHSPTQHIPVTIPTTSVTPPIESSTNSALSRGVSSSNTSGGLIAPPGARARQQDAQAENEMMDLDWSAIPSPSPSPPPTNSSASLSPMKARQGIGSMAGIGGVRSGSTSPVKKPVPKQNLMVPTDLSSAAKDFKL